MSNLDLAISKSLFSFSKPPSKTKTSFKTDYYEVLGVKPTSTLQKIEEAYRRVPLEKHPDNNVGDSSATAAF
jgi:DnaJ-domain-containing protein 1